MGEVEQFLATSEKLLSHLETTPTEEERTEFINQINFLLDAREETIQKLDTKTISTHPSFHHLLELDKSINVSLEKVMDIVKGDLKDLQQKKRHESSYTNPYAATQTLDGMYFDNKK